MSYGANGRGYGIGTFSGPGAGTFPGVVKGDTVWPLAALPGFEATQSSLSLFDSWDTADAALYTAMAAATPEAGRPLADLKVHAPLSPRQIFCTGANYRKHVIELTLKQPDPSTAGLSAEERVERVAKMMNERAAHGAPYAFIKLPSAVTGPYDQIVLPRGVVEPDWELELGVVIGRTARHVPRQTALQHVAGYLIVNDVTARDRIYRSDMKAIGTDWLASKNASTFLPTGPFVVPARFIPDPQSLRITLKLNGQVMQDEMTADMIFDVARQIEYVSSLVTLLPGDILCTGSPAGNGTHYQRFLQPGDVVEGSISGLGRQRLHCVAE